MTVKKDNAIYFSWQTSLTTFDAATMAVCYGKNILQLDKYIEAKYSFMCAYKENIQNEYMIWAYEEYTTKSNSVETHKKKIRLGLQKERQQQRKYNYLH